MPNKSENPDYLTIFPELLSLEELKFAIKQRHPRLPNLNNMTYEKALTIFQAMIMPLPQRKFNNSSTRGHRLQQRRKVSSEPSPKTSFSTTTPVKRLATSENSRDSSKTKIHLGSDSTRKSTPKLVINDRSESNSHKRTESAVNNDSEGDTPGSKPKRQKITWP